MWCIAPAEDAMREVLCELRGEKQPQSGRRQGIMINCKADGPGWIRARSEADEAVERARRDGSSHWAVGALGAVLTVKMFSFEPCRWASAECCGCEG